jgi:hypothetical protein
MYQNGPEMIFPTNFSSIFLSQKHRNSTKPNGKRKKEEGRKEGGKKGR